MPDDASLNQKAPLLDDTTGFPVENMEDEAEPLLMETDPLMIPGALEVEEAPVLSENLSDALGSDDTTSAVRDAAGSILLQSDVLDVQDESAMGLKELLAEANLGERHLRFCAIALVAGLMLLVGGLYWWFKPESVQPEKTSLFSSISTEKIEAWFSSIREDVGGFFKGEEAPQVSLEQGSHQGMPSIIVGSDRVNQQSEFAQAESAVAEADILFDLSYQLGVIRSGEAPELENAESMGLPQDLQDPFYAFLETWIEAKRLLSVDIQASVLASSNRRDVLNEYVQDLRLAMANLESLRLQLQKESEALAKSFAILQNEKEASEQEYFDALSLGSSALAVNALQSFIQKGEAIVGLRAHYLARTRLAQNIDRALPLMEVRIQDVEANKEAIIQGIKVYDFPKSDLELILDGDSL